jgi:hypothetical protein
LISASRCAVKIALTLQRNVATSITSGSALTPCVTGSVRHSAKAARLSIVVSPLVSSAGTRLLRRKFQTEEKGQTEIVGSALRSSPQPHPCSANLAVDRVGKHSKGARRRGMRSFVVAVVIDPAGTRCCNDARRLTCRHRPTLRRSFRDRGAEAYREARNDARRPDARTSAARRAPCGAHDRQAGRARYTDADAQRRAGLIERFGADAALPDVLMALAGVVTLPREERERTTPYGFSSGRDDLAPRAHRRGAKCAMRLG